MNTEREKSSKERVRAILSESVSVLCRTMLQYDAELSIRGLLGITVDNRDVFLVDILETVRGRNHDVSGVAVIDPGKEDSEADMLVVDDSDMEDKGQHSSMNHHQNPHMQDKVSKCPDNLSMSQSQSHGQSSEQHGDVVQMMNSESLARQPIGLKELGDAAFARSISQFQQQLATKAVNMKSTVSMPAGLNRVTEDTNEMSNTSVMTSQALNMSTTTQVDSVTSEPSDDPNFRLQNHDNERQQVSSHKHDEDTRDNDQEQQSTMYTLCACESTGDTADCTIKHNSSQAQTVWSHNETVHRSGDYVAVATQANVPPISQPASAPGTQVHTAANPSNPVLTNQDPYQLWNKTNNQHNTTMTTSASWPSLPLPAVSSVPSTTTWASQSQPQPQTVTVTTSTEGMASAPIQSLYSSLPETISSAILHTTYAQGGSTPKNLRGEGVFPCKLCSRVFTYKKSKARHMKRHLGQFYTCEVCKKTLCRKDVLARHQHNVHGIKMEAGGETSKSPQKSSTEEPTTISLLSQANEVAANSYPTAQSAGHGQRNYETVEFNNTNTPQLTVPRPPLAVVTSLSQPIQSFLTLNHTAIQSHQSPNQSSVQSNVQASLHHGASPPT